MSGRRTTGYRRFRATDVGAGTAEALWPVVRYLCDGHDGLTGRIVTVFARTTHVTVPTPGCGDRPAHVVFGTDDIRDGPLLVRLETPDRFSFVSPAAGRAVRFRLDAAQSRLSVDLAGGLTAIVPLSVIPGLPAGGGIHERFEGDRFGPTSETVEMHRELVGELRADGVEDGLGLLDSLHRRHTGQSRGRLDTLVESLRAALATDWGSVPSPVGSLLGRGPGATPSGDDFLVGALLVLRLVADDGIGRRVRRLGNRIATLAQGQTTRISAALLSQAARGRAGGPARDCVRVMTRPDPGQQALRAAARRVIETGHTSGADCLAGVLTATTTVLPRLAAGDDRGRTDPPQIVPHVSTDNAPN